MLKEISIFRDFSRTSNLQRKIFFSYKEIVLKKQ